MVKWFEMRSRLNRKLTTYKISKILSNLPFTHKITANYLQVE